MSVAQLGYTVLFAVATLAGAQAGPQRLGDASPYDRWSRDQSVFSVAIAPQELTAPYFSPESLKRLMPDLSPARIRADWCDGKERQRGVVVFTGGDVVFWHSCAPGLIVFEGNQYPGSFSFNYE
jgi:hypothetical protein